MFLELGKIYRYARPADPMPPLIGELPNFHFHTSSPGEAMAQLEKGINPIGFKGNKTEFRVPAILTRSSPHKVGSDTTPWDDIYDFENGHIRYYGDNKDPDQKPEDAPGNKALLNQFELHSTQDPQKRKLSAPIIFFKTVRYKGNSKGHVQFYGFGVIRRVELITQYDRTNSRFFSNYVFDFTILKLNKENQKLTWQWITDRRNPNLSLEDTLRNAPFAWRQFIYRGPSALNQLRYHYVSQFVKQKEEQQPPKDSVEYATLYKIYEHYTTTRKHRFEGLAEKIVAAIFQESNVRYHRGWITAASGDGGADFVGRLDLGSDFATVKVIVLGQAKCESPETATGGNHVARTVARLKRGWIGAYVTTSFFSNPVQREILEDEYPLMLVNGKKVAEVAQRLVQLEGHNDLQDLLDATDAEYLSRIQSRNPSEILHDVTSTLVGPEDVREHG